MEVRPTFEREQKRSAARVQNVNHCFVFENIWLSQVVATELSGRLRRFCGLSCWSDLHFSTGCYRTILQPGTAFLSILTPTGDTFVLSSLSSFRRFSSSK